MKYRQAKEILGQEYLDHLIFFDLIEHTRGASRFTIEVNDDMVEVFNDPKIKKLVMQKVDEQESNNLLANQIIREWNQGAYTRGRYYAKTK